MFHGNNMIDSPWPANAPPAPAGWWERAKCFGTPIEEMTLDGMPQKQRRAEKLCAGCPVLQECAIDVLHFQDRGIVRAATYIPGDGKTSNIKYIIERLETIAGRKDTRHVA